MVLEALAHDQLVLVDDARARAGDVGGADVDEPLELSAARQKLEHVAGALDVDALGELERDREVVDRGEVEDGVDLAGQPLVVGVVEARGRRSVMSPASDLDPLARRSRRPPSRGRSTMRGSTRHATALGVVVEQPRDERLPMNPGNPVTKSIRRGSLGRTTALARLLSPTSELGINGCN